MNWCVSPAGTCPLPGPLQFFLPCLWGMGNGSSPLTFTPAQKPPLPLSPYRRQRRGRGEGAGLPLGTAVAQSISPKLRNFLLPKRRKKEKKSQRPPFLPAPLGQSRLDLWGSWEGGSGLEHSQARVVEFPGRPSARPTLGFSPLPTSFPSKRPTRGGLPLPPGPWATGLHTGARWGLLHSPGEGGRWDPGSLHTISSTLLPQSWAFPFMSCCGDICSLLRSLCHLLPPLRWKAGLTPVLGEGRGLGHGFSASRGPLGNRDTGFSVLGVFV